ncbi:methyltransferase domain-containing protein [Sporosarcina soli]|uniref:Methyltransferase domain-containing protein n=1 Tax=Sporosarcina soli TaxID=334736 RepID=A0ABW0TN90_9BACL
MTLSKKMRNIQAMEQQVDLFRCPICTAEMEMVEHSRLVCSTNHSFDLSKSGYVNLAPQAHVTKYDKSLFEARTTVMNSGFFDPVLEVITRIIHEGSKGTPVILDAGCGEGSHLADIVSRLAGKASGIGIDLAKEGIAAAAKEHPGAVWSVADLANCPFQDEKFDVILNILSPANYAEFTRLLKKGGLCVKAVPEASYLKELRAIFYEENVPKEDTDPVGRFAEHFDAVQTERVTYTFPLAEHHLAPLIRMTPLTWGASEEKIRKALQLGLPEITIDFTVMLGVKRNG